MTWNKLKSSMNIEISIKSNGTNECWWLSEKKEITSALSLFSLDTPKRAVDYLYYLNNYPSWFFSLF